MRFKPKNIPLAHILDSSQLHESGILFHSPCNLHFEIEHLFKPSIIFQVVVNRLIDLRAQLKKLASEKGTKMSYMPLFIKVTLFCDLLSFALDSQQSFNCL